MQVEKNKARLYKYIWPPSASKGTLAIIGGIQPGGAINPISELQCRWVTRVFKGILNYKMQVVFKLTATYDKTMYDKPLIIIDQQIP